MSKWSKESHKRWKDSKHKDYLKDRKALKKELLVDTKHLVKDAKEFKDLDFGFFYDIVRDSLKLFYNLYSRKDVVVYEFDYKRPGHNNTDGEEAISGLLKALELCDLYDKGSNCYDKEGWPCYKDRGGNVYDEQSLLKTLFYIIGENIMEWWE